jgi:hypothetical protein
MVIFWGELRSLITGARGFRQGLCRIACVIIISQYKINKHYLKFLKYYEKLET